MNSPQKTIYIAILNQGEFRVELTQLVLNLDRNSEYRIIWDFPSDKPIAHNRGKIVQRFLESGADYLMMLDGDIIPSLDILHLVKYDYDVIGGLCYAYKGEGIMPLALVSNKKAGEHQYKVIETEQKGIKEVDAIGTGCIIIARRVLEDVKAPFVNKYDSDGIRVAGLDLLFCRKAKQKGYKVYVHLDYDCSHWTTTDLRQIYHTVTDSVHAKKLSHRTIK